MGGNHNGGLGIGVSGSKNILTKVPNIGSVSDIHANAHYYITKTEQGEIYISGLGKRESNGETIYNGNLRKVENMQDTNIKISSGPLYFLNNKIYTHSYNNTTEKLNLAEAYSTYTNAEPPSKAWEMNVFKSSGKVYINNYPDIVAYREKSNNRVRNSI